MAVTANDSHEQFTVKESKTISLIIGGFFLLLFLFMLYNHLFNQKSSNEYAMNKLNYLLIFTFVTAVGFFIRGFMHVTVITININGIYVAGEFKTNWQNFISVESTEKQITGSYVDNFIVLIKYYGEDGAGFVTEIAMQDTYNKSGEEVVDAIRSFYDLYNRN